MHIGDFSTGHLGANAIVGGSVPIATGAAMAQRYLGTDDVVVCFAGDGAYANGVVLESLNWASQYQWRNFLAGDKAYGLPIVYVIQNNHYGMTHRTDDEVMGIKALAVRGAGFAEDGMHAEIVNGMDVLAVRDAVTRATDLCRQGEGPVLIEASTYRYYGHSLSDPRNEYRTKEEEEAWKAVDPIESLGRQLIENKILDEEGLAEVRAKAAERNATAAIRASKATDPAPEDVLKYMYAGTSEETVPAKYANPTIYDDRPAVKVTDAGMLQKDALREAMIEEMERDERVVFYGEDVADYGGAFKASKGLMERFGRDRVFNTPISEAAIIGTGVGAAMAGMRPVVELMYMDFALMASDQIANQAGKWHFMSGGQTTVPMVIRCSVGAGKGYGGQHSQSLECLFTHLPGPGRGLSLHAPRMPRACSSRPSAPTTRCSSARARACTRRAVRCPRASTPCPLGKSAVVREGGDATIVAWGPAVPDALKAAEQLAGEGIECEVIDLRTLVPLDMEPVLASVAKTGRCVVAAQAILSGSYVNEIVARVVNEAFDDLDAPVARIGAANGISPQAEGLEAAFLPGADDIAIAVKGLI